jgi:predicted metal-dependent TIM-barrel fold hydrolase
VINFLKERGLELSEEKTLITHIDDGFDFLGFTIRPSSFKVKDSVKIIPNIFVSQKSKNSLMEKFRKLNIHKRRTTLEEIAKTMNPILRGIINYYHKFRKNDLQNVWRQLNERLLKWVKWEKGLYKKASIRYLKTKYKEKPNLFLHWLLVHPKM